MNDPDPNGHKAGKRLLLWLLIALGIAGCWSIPSRRAWPNRRVSSGRRSTTYRQPQGRWGWGRGVAFDFAQAERSEV